jgi:hypothetical protein
VSRTTTLWSTTSSNWRRAGSSRLAGGGAAGPGSCVFGRENRARRQAVASTAIGHWITGASVCFRTRSPSLPSGPSYPSTPVESAPAPVAAQAQSRLRRLVFRVDCQLPGDQQLRFTCGVQPLPVYFNASNELPSELTGAEGSRQVTAPAVTQIKKGRLTRPFSAASWDTTLSNP